MANVYLYLPNDLFNDSRIVLICNLIDSLSNKNYLIHKFSAYNLFNTLYTASPLKMRNNPMVS